MVGIGTVKYLILTKITTNYFNNVIFIITTAIRYFIVDIKNKTLNKIKT